MTFHYQLDIAAPIEVVWQFLDDDKKQQLWMTQIVETTYPKGKNKEDPVGTEFRQKVKEGGRVKEYDGVVTAYHAPTLLSVLIGDEDFQMDVTYILHEEGPRTRLDYSCDIDVNNIFARIMGFLFRPLTMRIRKHHMANLKRVAEEAAGQ